MPKKSQFKAHCRLPQPSMGSGSGPLRKGFSRRSVAIVTSSSVPPGRDSFFPPQQSRPLLFMCPQVFCLHMCVRQMAVDSCLWELQPQEEGKGDGRFCLCQEKVLHDVNFCCPHLLVNLPIRWAIHRDLLKCALKNQLPRTYFRSQSFREKAKLNITLAWYHNWP